MPSASWIFIYVHYHNNSPLVENVFESVVVRTESRADCRDSLCLDCQTATSSQRTRGSEPQTVVGVHQSIQDCQQTKLVTVIVTVIHRVSAKNKQNYFCYNYVKLPPNLTIFGIIMANSLKLYEVHLFPPHLIYVNTLPRVKRRCSKLLHNSVGLIISIRLLTFASPIRQKVPHDLIILWFNVTPLKYSTLKVYNSW